MSRLRKMQNQMMSADLCHELIADIFTRLPTKTLLRCRSLSKSWYSFIGSPDFIRMHTFRSRQKLLIRHRSYKENEDGEYDGFYTLHQEDRLPLYRTCGYIGITPVEFPSTYSVIIGSCDGIVCLFDYNENRISLWNPSIRRTQILPDCPRRCCYSGVEIGFGFDRVTDDYKIVCIPGENEKGDECSYVYTMKTDSWCMIPSPVPVFCEVRTKACFVSGALHWPVQRYGGCSYYILTFDLATHVFSRTASPKPSRTVAPTSIQGSLAVIIDKSSRDKWIWMRRDASWSVVHKLKKNKGAQYLRGVLQLATTGDLVFDCKGFPVYNPKTEACSRLVDFNNTSFLLDIVPCVETLQLLDVGTSC